MASIDFPPVSFQTETLNLLGIIQPWMSRLGLVIVSFSLGKLTSLRLQPVLVQDNEDNHPLRRILKRKQKQNISLRAKVLVLMEMTF